MLLLLGRNLAPINPVRATSGKRDRGEEEMLVGSSVKCIFGVSHSQMAFFGVFPIPIQTVPGPEKSVMAKSEIAALVDDRVEPGVGKMFISFALQIRYTTTTTPIALDL